jgi:hypothetical protein
MSALAERLARDAGDAPPAVYDTRIDAPTDDPSVLTHVKHQALMRCYQARYVLLPSAAPAGSIVDHLARHYGVGRIQDFSGLRPELEADLIESLLAGLDTGETLEAYTARILPGLDTDPANAFLDALEDNAERRRHYCNFLVQSSADLLAEASAAALGVIGEFGPAQSALFRILIDEFGYGAHGRKHSILYRATLRSFGLADEYNHYWPLFDTPALTLHNAIHFLFQNPRNLFKQVGFLLFAEAAYRRATELHARHLARFHPDADARYFREHAHIDRHHARMVVDEVAAPLVAQFGADVGREVIVGAELTRLQFEAMGAHLAALVRAFDAVQGRAYGLDDAALAAPLVTPRTATGFGSARIQVGAVGTVPAEAFAAFPDGAVGRALRPDA